MTQLCTFFLDRQYFGVPIDRVQEVVRPQRVTPVPLAPVAVAGLMNLRGQIVTALDLRRVLGMAQGPEARGGVVLRCEECSVGLLVDAVDDVLDASDEAFEPAPQTLRGSRRALIAGAYKLEGRLLLALDVDRLLQLDLAA